MRYDFNSGYRGAKISTAFQYDKQDVADWEVGREAGGIDAMQLWRSGRGIISEGGLMHHTQLL